MKNKQTTQVLNNTFGFESESKKSKIKQAYMEINKYFIEQMHLTWLLDINLKSLLS